MNDATEKKLTNQYVKAHYSRAIGERYDNEYEFNRWFTSPQSRADYFMNYSAILAATDGISFSSCLEMGPGPGTWTRVIYHRNPSARFDLVDISETMRAQFVSYMGAREENVHYHVSDFMEFSAPHVYDLFFSSRAYEYLDDKDGFVAKLASLMAPGGYGIVITKNPLHVDMKNVERFLHSAQTDPSTFKTLLERNGFTDVRCVPAVMRIGANIPGLGVFSVYLSERLFKRMRHVSLFESWIARRYSESYVICFRKPV